MNAKAAVVVLTREELDDVIDRAVAKALAARVADSDWITLEQAAKALAVCEKTVMKYVTEQGLPASKLDREHRFSRSEITKWLESRAVKRGAPVSAYGKKIRAVNGGQ